MKVYDSVYTYCDMEKEAIISNLFQYNAEKPVITISRSQKQKGNVDCGLFAIATATAFGKNPSKLQFIQEAMRPHLINCFTQKLMSIFPCKSK